MLSSQRNIGIANSVTRAPAARRSRRRLPDVTLTADDIARLTGTPLRTVQYRLSRWHARDVQAGRTPVVTSSSRAGVGGVRWSVPLAAYCARVGLDADDVLETLTALAA